MKVLVVLMVVAALAASEDHNVEKRSPDDVVFFYPLTEGAGGRGSLAQGRTRGMASSTGFPFSRGYFLDLDDLYDDRRKRQVKPSDSATHRQKRAADFDDDDDDFFIRRLFNFAPSTYTTAPRTSSSVVSSVIPSPFTIPFSRYFYDDDLFDRRKKRSADPDDDDDDFYYHYVLQNAPVVTGYSAPVQTVATTQARTRQPVAYTPYVYYYDFDDKK